MADDGADDEWWHGLTPRRKRQIRLWITQGGGGHLAPAPGQLPLVDVPDSPEPVDPGA